MKEVTFSTKEQWIIFLSVNSVLFLILLLFPMYMDITKNFLKMECGMVRALHLYCPACGGTRAFAALINFEIVSSVLYNPVVLVETVIFIIYEVTMIKYLIKGIERPLFINMKVLTVLLILWGVYFIARNVFLFFGIDYIGDIII